jgi:4-azaleucine resistance transporter AzlC
VVSSAISSDSSAAGDDVVTASLTLGAAVGVFGLVFGVGAVAAGASVIQTCAMSLLVFTGASQFSAVSVVAAGGGTSAALGGAMVLAARNAVYGLAMSRVITGSLATRALAAQLTIDESTAMASVQRDPAAKRRAFWITGAAVYVCWNTATLVGALVGSAIEPETYGLDVAFPAGFVAMVAPHLRHRLGLVAAVLGGTICLVLIPFTPVGVPILCSSAAVLVGLRAPDAAHPDDLPDEGVIV